MCRVRMVFSFELRISQTALSTKLSSDTSTCAIKIPAIISEHAQLSEIYVTYMYICIPL